MENAAKALVIAGGILLAIMTLSLLVYMTSATSRMAEAQDQKIEHEQLVAFNSTYEAYNKNRMYGVDAISVAKKAINYNIRLDPSKAGEAVTIELILKEDFCTTKQTIRVDENGITTEGPIENDGAASLKKGTYIFGYNYPQVVLDFFSDDAQNPDPEVKYSGKTIIKTYKYTGLTNFKKAIFECKGTEYNDSGRISKMTFEQVLID